MCLDPDRGSVKVAARPRNQPNRLKFREKINRSCGGFSLFRRIRKQFNSFQQIFSLFNQLSGRLQLVLSDYD
jgi:hypothetical protein